MQLSRQHDTIWIAGTLTDNRPHKHHALQVSWAPPNGLIRLRTDQTVLEGRCIIVESGAEHSLEMQDGLIALVDPESAAGCALRAKFLAGTSAATVDSPWDGTSLPDLSDPHDHELDPRIEAVLSWLDELEAHGKWAQVDLSAALKVAHLSDSRFLHLFSEQVGTPWRTYLVWRRALVAMTLALEGSSLTRAAHEAGYSDSAHLSRQFVSLFGITPGAFVREAEIT